MKCLIALKKRDSGLEEEYIEKDMIKRYNINRVLLREQSAKKERINHLLD